MTGMTFDEMQAHNAALIMKTLEVAVFTADYSADAITTLTDIDKGLKPLPAGWGDLGWLSDDGAQFSRDVDQSDITAAGSVEPVRSDITSDVTTLQVTCLETNLRSIGLYTGADMSTVTPDPTTGEVGIAKPTRPAIKYYRVLGVGSDLTDAGEYYVGRFLPRSKVDDFDDQNYQSSDDTPNVWPVTLKGFTDPVLGYSEKYFWGGPGWYAKLADMGFSV
jgi:hypothetical protein